ncbi:hypothetical protein [Micromonospora coxensis]|nr:hypothetical protein [Micromonospora coxensis]
MPDSRPTHGGRGALVSFDVNHRVPQSWPTCGRPHAGTSGGRYA